MRKEYELTNLESCMSKALPNEETFVLLARDPAAVCAIAAWIETRIALGLNTRCDEQIGNAQRSASLFDQTRKAIREEVTKNTK